MISMHGCRQVQLRTVYVVDVTASVIMRTRVADKGPEMCYLVWIDHARWQSLCLGQLAQGHPWVP